jgi:hypothetical protein
MFLLPGDRGYAMNEPLSRRLIAGLVVSILALEFIIFAWGAHAGYKAGQKQARIACVTEATAKVLP